jgi:hypothetical protein
VWQLEIRLNPKLSFDDSETVKTIAQLTLKQQRIPRQMADANQRSQFHLSGAGFKMMFG